MITMFQKTKNFLGDENGATAIEYGLIASVLSLSILPVLDSLSSALSSKYSSIAGYLEQP